MKFYFNPDWGLNRSIKGLGSYRPYPIAPPPGYEHEDMTAPKKIGPDSMAEILRSKGVDIGESPPPAPATPLASSTPVAVSPKTIPVSGKTWWALLVLLILVASAGWCRALQPRTGDRP